MNEATWEIALHDLPELRRLSACVPILLWAGSARDTHTHTVLTLYMPSHAAQSVSLYYFMCVFFFMMPLINSKNMKLYSLYMRVSSKNPYSKVNMSDWLDKSRELWVLHFDKYPAAHAEGAYNIQILPLEASITSESLEHRLRGPKRQGLCASKALKGGQNRMAWTSGLLLPKTFRWP